MSGPPADVARLAVAIGRLFADAQLAEPNAEARRLVRAVLGYDALLDADLVLADDEREILERATRARLAGRPVSRIIGRRAFWTFELTVTPDVLDPRPETEHVVECLLEGDAPNDARVLDFGVGSGAILLAVLSERPGWFGVGLDRSEAAVSVARANAAALSLSGQVGFLVGDWAGSVTGRFDRIGANPPYVAAGAIDGLAREVAEHDPRLALDGGRDGLDAYRALGPQIARLLAPRGVAALEVGRGQAVEVSALLAQHLPNAQIDTVRDLAGLDRVVRIRAP